MNQIAHEYVDNRGVKIHTAILGSGPVVVMCHGMPGLWYSWRHQMSALADAGYQAVAIDQRGFGMSDRPLAASEYTSHHTVSDVIAVMDYLDAGQAILVGIDFGAAQAYNCAVRHPARVKGVIGMACPYDFDFSGRGCAGSAPVDPATITRAFARPDISPNACFARIAQSQFFYAHYFQSVGEAEKELAAKPREFLRKLFWNLSGQGDLLGSSQAPVEARGYCDVLAEPEMALPWPWLSVEDFNYYLEQFCNAPAGMEFIGGLNLYRAADANWHINARFCDETIGQPSLFIAGARDPVLGMIDDNALDAFRSRCDDLRGIILIEGAGHFVPMEKPAQTNAQMLRFLASL